MSTLERNIEIYEKYKNGENIIDLSAEYRLSHGTIRNIFVYVEDHFYKLQYDELYSLLHTYTSDIRMLRRIYNALERGGIHTVTQLVLADIRDLAKIRCIGDACMEILISIIDKYKNSTKLSLIPKELLDDSLELLGIDKETYNELLDSNEFPRVVDSILLASKCIRFGEDRYLSCILDEYANQFHIQDKYYELAKAVHILGTYDRVSLVKYFIRKLVDN